MASFASAPRGAQPWSIADSLAIAAVTVVACSMRAFRLTSLPFIYSDELFYAREACNYVFRSPSTCGIPLDAVSAHPPLGKWLISLGIRAFGWEPFGWRFASVVAGTVTVALMYLMVRRLLRSTPVAMFASGLLALDFLHLVQSRIAMLDVFLTMFVVAAFTCVVLDRESQTRNTPNSASTQTVWSTVRRRRWLVVAGLACGGAIATKWVGILALLGSAILALIWMLRANPAERPGGIAATLRREWLALIVAFALAPGVAYAAAYGPRIEGTVLTAPWVRGSWVRGFAREQRDMLEFHRSSAEIRYLGTTNPFASPAWSWPLVRRPMIYYSEPRTAAGRETVMAMGNPVVWWPALACLVVLALRLVRRRANDAEVVAVIGFAAVYGPLLLISAARPATFLYYMLPAVPFMCLAVAIVMNGWGRKWAARGMLGVSVAAVASFSFFYPVLTARPLSDGELAARQWFRDCDVPAQYAPPTGWCWR